MMLFCYEILRSMLQILQQYGTQPEFKSQALVSHSIEKSIYGIHALNASGNNKSDCITGFTAAFFVTLPAFFTQWFAWKDLSADEQPKNCPTPVLGLQCLWPTFATK
jgi:hypothetical protein